MDLPGLLARRLPLFLLPLTLVACRAQPSAAALPTPAAWPPLPTTAALAAVPSPSPTLTPSPTLSPTPTPPASATPSPSATAPPTPLPTATPTPTETPSPTTTPDPSYYVNGVPVEEIAVLPPETQAHVREIIAGGRELGRNPHAFSKLGDSAVLVESNLTRFDRGVYELGPYARLQPAIDHFAGSFRRYGEAARLSLTAIGATDPMFADPSACLGGETLLACEFRLHNPAVLLIRLGTNDGDARLYETYLRRLVEFAIENGVVPVLGTKADRFEGDDSINEATRRVAAEYAVPLWDFDRAAGALPDRGLGDDNAHLTMTYSNDYSDPETLTRGYPVSDLTALMMLDALRALLLEEN